jgi:putative secretion ATPase (PEP-CTERM system associated)
MYETFYGLSAKPFQLRPDPHFYFGSKGHKRAMAYLEYGLSQGEGFIVITGEVGAGKTTLVRNLFNRLPLEQIVAAHIVNTHVNADDALRMVAAAFGLPAEGATKGELLTRIEQFLRQADRQGKRALLVIDEAQNLNMATVEELRMLSNFQTDSRCLLQTFLLGQPEFRATLHRPGMQQLRQRVIASYHLGPMDAQETRAYIEHRLQTVGWRGDPAFSDEAHAAIYAYSGGIPRKTNTLCDRILLMGYLEELHAISAADVATVVQDIREEFELPEEELVATAPVPAAPGPVAIDERMAALEHSMVSVLSLLKNMAGTPRGALAQPVDGAQ